MLSFILGIVMLTLNFQTSRDIDVVTVNSFHTEILFVCTFLKHRKQTNSALPPLALPSWFLEVSFLLWSATNWEIPQEYSTDRFTTTAFLETTRTRISRAEV